MAYKIPLIKTPFFNTKLVQKKLSKFVVSTDRFSMHENCKKFETAFSKEQKRKYTVLYNSGSSANFALIQALVNLGWLNRGDLVGFTSIGWPTTIMPLLQLGLEPIPMDIDLNYLDTSLSNVVRTTEQLKREGKKLSAIFYTNILGSTGDIEDIRDYCNKNKIILLEDNCESLGSEYNRIKTGNFGLASTFSFFVGHHFSCIEGGAVCTDSKDLADMLIMVRAHGWDRNLDKSKQKELRSKYKIDEFNAQYTFYTIGMNLRPSEITGYLGLLQLPYLKTIVNKRQENYLYLLEAIKTKFDKVYDIYQHDKMNVISNFAFPIVFKSKNEFEKNKEKFIKNGLEVRPIIGGNLVDQPFFARHRKQSTYSIPNTITASTQGLYFGNNPDLTKPELQYLKKLLLSI